MVKRIQVLKVKQICKTKLPIKENQRIDLDTAVILLGNEYNVSYDPFGLPRGLFIRFNKVTFLVFSNGSVTSTGLLGTKKQEELLNGLFKLFKKRGIIINYLDI